MVRESLYIVHVHGNDYFVVIAKSQKDAVKKLREYWYPITDGMDKMYCSVSRGQPIKVLKKGRHFAWFQKFSIANGDFPEGEEPDN